MKASRPAAFLRSCRRLLLCAAAALLGFPAAIPALAGDTILFHDGMRTLCTGRAWEEKDQVLCEYRGAILTYPRKEVLRIEKGPTAASGKEEPRKQEPPPPSLRTLPGPEPPRKQGPPFYDPRRPKRYWSSPTRHHDTYEQAVAALAAEFGKPAPWVEERLAESNDLNEIRDRLRREPEATEEKNRAESRETLPAASGVEFYNPRRPKRYWTSPEAKHDTLAEAVQALSREFGKPPEWIERHMGAENDTGLIRRALREALDAGAP